MYYVGIDPSTKTGLVILDENMNVIYRNCIVKKIDPDFKTNIWAKLNTVTEIVEEVLNILLDYEIKEVMLESLSYLSKGNQVDLQIALGYMLRDALRNNKIYVGDVAPTSLKKFATGNGRSNKKHMLEAANNEGFITKNDNEADAYFLAKMCYKNKQ